MEEIFSFIGRPHAAREFPDWHLKQVRSGRAPEKYFSKIHDSNFQSKIQSTKFSLSKK